MSGTSWFETRKVTLVALLENRLKGNQLLLDSAPDGSAQAARLSSEVDRLTALIAKRKASPEHQVTVRHIGSVDDPNAHELLEAEEMRLYQLANIRARKAILDAGGEPGGELLSSFLASDVEWRKQQGALAKKWITAGLVSGDTEYARLFALGGAALLQEAVEEVKRWQNVEFEQGEG